MRMRRTGPEPLDATMWRAATRGQLTVGVAAAVAALRHSTTPVPTAFPMAEAVQGARTRQARVLVDAFGHPRRLGRLALSPPTSLPIPLSPLSPLSLGSHFSL